MFVLEQEEYKKEGQVSTNQIIISRLDTWVNGTLYV